MKKILMIFVLCVVTIFFASCSNTPPDANEIEITAKKENLEKVLEEAENLNIPEDSETEVIEEKKAFEEKLKIAKEVLNKKEVKQEEIEDVTSKLKIAKDNYINALNSIISVTFDVDSNKANTSGDLVQKIKKSSSKNEVKYPEIKAKVGFKFEGWDKELPEILEENAVVTAKFVEEYSAFKEEVDKNFENQAKSTASGVNKVGKYQLDYIPGDYENPGVLNFNLQGEKLSAFSLAGTGFKTALSEFFSASKTGKGNAAKYLDSVTIINEEDSSQNIVLDKAKLDKINKASREDIGEFLPLTSLFESKDPENKIKLLYTFIKDGETYEKIEIINIIK